jgi:hypothetical protein
VAPSRRALRAWRTASAGEVDPYQPGPGAGGGDLQAIAATAAGQVHQRAAREQAQPRGGLGNPVPAEQARGQQVRGQAQMTLLDRL